MDIFTWKNSCKTVDLSIHVSNLLSFVVSLRIEKGKNTELSYGHVFFINQGGLQERRFPSVVKEAFKKEVMDFWQSVFPSMSNQFTGTMEVHIHNLSIEIVKFIPKKK